MISIFPGVKRKADTTTPTANAYDYAPPLESKSAKISTRRESGRQIKKPARPEIDDTICHKPPSHKPKEKLSEPLKACNEILMELFSKKHSVRIVTVLAFSPWKLISVSVYHRTQFSLYTFFLY